MSTKNSYPSAVFKKKRLTTRKGWTMPILLLVHVEESFRHHFPKGYVRRLVTGCKSKLYEKVIHATSNIEDDSPIPEIAELVDEEIDWGWGYEPEVFRDRKELKWLISSKSHEYTWVPPELREIHKNTQIVLGGGYDGECLEDMITVLNHLHLYYEINRQFVYP
jgi:hypothetical protein